mmetsp:Transcript_41752/g.104344  ORF Transcript_41752/g.104344 Transcript_41752/m.104344 type:complete len:753 (+) Transcript_41752:38-2296(+)
MEEQVKAVCQELLKGLDPDVLEYISGCVLDDEKLLPKEDLVEVVAPLLESADLCSSDSEAEALAEQLWEKLNADGLGTERKAEVVLLKSAVLMGGMEKEEDEKKEKAMLMDPKLARRGGNAFGTNVVEEEPDVHSKASIAKARNDAKAKAKREAAAEAARKEQLEMEEDLSRARMEVARLRLKGDMESSSNVLETEPFELPNPGGGENLLEDVCLRLVPGHRYGLIGRNGKGKSTLLRWFASRRIKGLPKLLSVHYVAQEIPLAVMNEGLHPLDMVLAADVEREALLSDLAELEERSKGKDEDDAGAAAMEMASVHEKLHMIDSDGAEGRARSMLVSLGFSEELLNRKMKDLSGGWRVRVALASALFAKPDVLLLDEPTNHLSIDAVLWLQRTLSLGTEWKNRIIVVVSHDRTFINEVCGDMLHISGVARRLTHHKGNYDLFASKRAEMQAAWAKTTELRQAKRDKLLEYTRRQGRAYTLSATIAAKMQRVKQIEKLDNEADEEENEFAYLEEDEDLALSLQGGGELELPVAKLEDVAFGYSEDKMLFKGVNMCIDGKSRICLLGENGAGKTTLVKVMMGLLDTTKGFVSRDHGARFALVNQHHADQLDLSLTPLAFMHQTFPGDGSYGHEQALRSALAQTGVYSELQTTVINCLSGGQRSRVALAVTSMQKPHVLVMDEPTNNLDIESVEALADAVAGFPGGVILVSHDQTFVSKVAKEVMLVGGGKVTKLESFEAYCKQVMKKVKTQDPK